MVASALVPAAAIVALWCSQAMAFQSPEAKLVNQGQACLETYGGAPPSWVAEVEPLRLGFMPGRPIYVSVGLPTCLNSCVTGTATCDVTVSGKVILISSEGQLRDTGEGYDLIGSLRMRFCTAACFSLNARCQSAPLPAGRYEVRYGRRSTF